MSGPRRASRSGRRRRDRPPRGAPASPGASAGFGPWTACRSRWPRDRSSGSSARTAPARPPPSTSSPATIAWTRAPSGSRDGAWPGSVRTGSCRWGSPAPSRTSASSSSSRPLENVLSGRHCRTRAGLLAAMLRPPRQVREEREALARVVEELAFVGLAGQGAGAGPEPLPRRPAAAGDRPGPGHRPEAAGARRARRRHERAGDRRAGRPHRPHPASAASPSCSSSTT